MAYYWSFLKRFSCINYNRFDAPQIQLVFFQPRNPQQNAYVERYNRTVRYDWLSQYLFESIAEVQLHATLALDV